ncbi:hypothetical protein QQY66_23085 [Streptomyces sp. DG2A-72]|uniref:hypothetical protein n=1 Tax=Streptomyces sp. DG2A-72 TaxID=3051386 RepID=UPI00265BE6B8|nr:hypothetical protein [Streptomyces sp. DG2A-72]MDO0934420.1 hypothetical protein [Streptomyces sp. DG2A-72]
MLEVLADHALAWPDGAGKLRMAGSLLQTWDAPLALDAALEQLLAGATSDELRGMLAALGVKPPSTKPPRLAALVEHHSNRERVVAVVATAPGDGPEAARQAKPRPCQASRSPSCSALPAPVSHQAPGGRWTGDS